MTAFSESLTEAKQKAKLAQITSDFSSSESHKKKKKEHTLKRSRNNSKQTKKLPRPNKPPIFTNISGRYQFNLKKKMYNSVFILCFLIILVL